MEIKSFADLNTYLFFGDEKERKAMEKKALFEEVVKEIKEFTPAKEKLGNEYCYQLNLHGWLKRTFPSTVIEEQKGSSRPDIVIDNTIAIEIKGPTGVEELKTIADKVIRYAQHFEGIIIVLFEVNVNEQYYQEWFNGIKKLKGSIPNIEVIKKS
jgi:hypothetical protein